MKKSCTQTLKLFVFLLFTWLPFITFGQLADSAARLVHLQGALNFRDVGGYKTANGKEVVWGKVFRSAEISKLTEADLATLTAKHIHTVIDFRGTGEAAQAPDKLLPGTDYTLSPAGSNNLPGFQKKGELIKKGGFIKAMYGDSSVQFFGERYRPLFQKLLVLPDTTAILFHCTGGRDRTGMATALFLYALGVPKQKIEEDFVASNTYLEPINRRMFQQMAQGLGMTTEEVQKEMELTPELLQNFFGAIEKKYGSVNAFLKTEIGIGKNELIILKAKYTK